jgi:hypothetical protein
MSRNPAGKKIILKSHRDLLSRHYAPKAVFGPLESEGGQQVCGEMRQKVNSSCRKASGVGVMCRGGRQALF